MPDRSPFPDVIARARAIMMERHFEGMDEVVGSDEFSRQRFVIEIQAMGGLGDDPMSPTRGPPGVRMSPCASAVQRRIRGIPREEA